MTANVLVPLVIVIYLFVMDWRMALLSLVTLVVGLAVRQHHCDNIRHAEIGHHLAGHA